MGRTSYKYRPRMYVFYPVTNLVDQAAGVDHDGINVRVPFVGDNRGMPEGASVLGAALSCRDCVTGGSATLDLRAGTGSGTTRLTTVPTVTNSVPNRFRFTRCLDDAEAGDHTLTTADQRNLQAAPASRGMHLYGNAVGGADVFNIPGGYLVISPGGLHNSGRANTGSGGIHHPSGLGSDVTHDSGAVIGGLAAISFPCMRSINGTTIMSTLPAPCDGRIQALVISQQAGSANNQFIVRNQDAPTADKDIIAAVTFDQSPQSQIWTPTTTPSFDAVRDFSAGDELDFRMAAGAGPSTEVNCTIYFTVLSHFNTPDARRDLDLAMPTSASTPARSNHRSWMTGRGPSGPAIGGYVSFMPCAGLLAISQADTILSTYPVPFDMEIAAVDFVHPPGAAAGATVWLETTNLGALMAAQSVSGTAVYVDDVQSNITTTTVSRGDTFELHAATAAVALEHMQCIVTAVVKGFPHDDPTLD